MKLIIKILEKYCNLDKLVVLCYTKCIKLKEEVIIGMILEFWNTVWIYLFSRCLFGFKIDTSRLPFSALVRFIPFYKANFWYNADYEFDAINDVMEYKIDLIIPFLCDIMIIKQV